MKSVYRQVGQVLQSHVCPTLGRGQGTGPWLTTNHEQNRRPNMVKLTKLAPDFDPKLSDGGERGLL